MNTNKPNEEKKGTQSRREWVKSLATAPLLGVMAYGVYKKIQHNHSKRSFGEMFNLGNDTAYTPVQTEGETIRIGIIGNGIRGTMLMKSLGFVTPEEIDLMKEFAANDPKYKKYEDFMNQESLNVEIVAVCDIFKTYSDRAFEAGMNFYREGKGGKMGKEPIKYANYIDLLNDPNVDAVVIATPDHWHSTMTIEAAKRGKHVYLEKPMSWTVEETYSVREAVKKSGIVFQLGHQGRQTDFYRKAQEIYEKGLLGKVSLIEVTTNRNDPNGAWQYPIHETASPKTIDWSQFIPPKEQLNNYVRYMKANKLERFMGPTPLDEFSLERFFRWRCWWDYSTGLSGDLLTHEFDAMNQILSLGIPHSATSSGGVYFYKDGRTVPDVLQTTFEYPDRDLTMLYSASLSSSHKRGKVIMGHDASLQLDQILTLTVDPQSTQFKEQIEAGSLPTDEPAYTYIPGKSGIDVTTSATERYFATRGLLYTYVQGKRYDTTFLHIKEWLECIRNPKATPSCNIDRGFEEAIAAHMGTRAYLEGRTMYWDKEKEEIVRG